jgi:aminoglycoside 3-N-acetyltransferase
MRRRIEKQLRAGKALTAEDVAAALRQAGLRAGDKVLVHASLSRLGALAEGPRTVLDAIMQVVGPEGDILMPTSPNPSLQLAYMRTDPLFDAVATPSAMGALSELFRKQPGVHRSLHPTESVAALGPHAQWLTEGHAYAETPYSAASPFHRLAELKGKVLYLGVSLIQAGTSLHLLEDAVPDFPYPVYHPERFTARVRDAQGRLHAWPIRVHNPEWSAKRRCDELIPAFEAAGVAVPFRLGGGPCWLYDADGMLRHMLKAYRERGVTMYTPHGA